MVIGVLAVTILIVNVNLPHVIEMLCSVAIVWANLAYLLVTFPLLLARLRRNASRPLRPAAPDRDFTDNGDFGTPVAPRPYFSLGRFGLPINVIAVLWGLFVVINIGWPRPEIYGSGPLGPLRGAARHARPDRPRRGLFPPVPAQQDGNPGRARRSSDLGRYRGARPRFASC